MAGSVAGGAGRRKMDGEDGVGGREGVVGGKTKRGGGR